MSNIEKELAGLELINSALRPATVNAPKVDRAKLLEFANLYEQIIRGDNVKTAS